MLDTEIFLGGIMKNYNEKDWGIDIKRFQETGKLPADFDVRVSNGRKQSSPYWNFVSHNLGGREPLYNSGDVPVEEEAISTDYGAEFGDWIRKEFPKLKESDQVLFNLVWERGFPTDAVARVFQVSSRTIRNRVARLRTSIAKWVGIRGM
jgi:DNA-directed RNA polymerase specialized sigma24 family protein